MSDKHVQFTVSFMDFMKSLVSQSYCNIYTYTYLITQLVSVNDLHLEKFLEVFRSFRTLNKIVVIDIVPSFI